MTTRVPTPKIFIGSDGQLSLGRADQTRFHKLDLTNHDETMLEKLGFVIKAYNRFAAFIEAVERVETVIQKYESLGLPLREDKSHD
ncbi:hypothetical protein SAMN04488117_101588 [Celeribacter baekdonensis]|uniref:Uncharacterized protein n=1 Tax=Celeribacter baekdonensis TaxID=875171 RepID=A0A1G7GJ39_9RHOB|nr:hypothetical protein [Celeribacter baekdonensis]SDE88124.1 hypothetical protein SAMN04488117_101588 [Celeribacter baekdonensis]